MSKFTEAYATRRSCRAYRSRLCETIWKAVATWKYLYNCEAPKFEPISDNCVDLSRETKCYLQACPAVDQHAEFAWNSIKKLQPASCRCMEAPLLSSVANHFRSPPPSLPRGYVTFARKIVRRLFPHGWDAGSYESCVLGTDPSLSACLENRRSAGGLHGYVSNPRVENQLGRFRHDDFLTTCLDGATRPLSVASGLTVVQSAGKPRPLSKFSADAIHLRPLHKAIYDRLSREKWLCRGDFTTDVLQRAGFSFVEGEVLTSGDYKSATDNLSIEVAEAILDELLKSTVSVPGSMKAYAMNILRPTLFNLEHGIDDFIPSRGQMMGSFLSFPLLCLQNRIAFLYAGESVGIDNSEFPCLINGDDILFRSGPHFSARWMDVVGDLSLEVEKTKTSVSPLYGSLNSTLCERRGAFYRVVATVRMGMLRESESLDTLSKGFDDFIAGLKGSLRFRAAMAWFSWNIGKIRPLGLTTHDLGFRGPLAYRATKKFGLRLGPSLRKVPSLKIENGLSLTCEYVDPDLLDDEEKKENLAELAAWKWRTGFECFSSSRAAMRFHLAVSATRTDAPDFKPYLYGGESGVLSRSVGGAKVFMQRVKRNPRGFPLLIPMRGKLPSYEEVLAGEVDVGSVEPLTKEKKK
ncbi:RNA dependent RNA polymerase [Plasmopara viticola lesion associated ourmia-like virus 76]|uniref:RNA dependent RNA polymerase n=2 Tax=Botourmiaviridae TaxID=2560063 RepID=A0ABX6FJ19_9VIRU|nr:RNA dependent RNA polymerase [Plasmopara viticola lesion associated ourmia-like virus 76]QGY72606.1 RNA dependent RNA polymerase [Plasmopara viticola lesion associated ourmia-like virus 76]